MPYIPQCVTLTKRLFEIRSGEPYGGDFENRSAADIWVREHRKRGKRHQMAARVEFPNGLLAANAVEPSASASAFRVFENVEATVTNVACS